MTVTAIQLYFSIYLLSTYTLTDKLATAKQIVILWLILYSGFELSTLPHSKTDILVFSDY